VPSHDTFGSDTQLDVEVIGRCDQRFSLQQESIEYVFDGLRLLGEIDNRHATFAQHVEDSIRPYRFRMVVVQFLFR